MLDNFSYVLLILDYQDIFNSAIYPQEVAIKVSNLQSSKLKGGEAMLHRSWSVKTQSKENTLFKYPIVLALFLCQLICYNSC